MCSKLLILAWVRKLLGYFEIITKNDKGSLNLPQKVSNEESLKAAEAKADTDILEELNLRKFIKRIKNKNKPK